MKEKTTSNSAVPAIVNTTEIASLKSQLTRLDNQAEQISITTQDEYVSATNLKSALSAIGKTIKTRKEEITKPLNEALKSARQLFAPLEEQFENAETIVGRKLLAYKQKVDAEIRAKEEKIARDLEAGKIKNIETAERKIEKLDDKRIEKTVQTSHGQVQFRKIKKVGFANLKNLSTDEIMSLVRDEYVIWDQVKARRDALSGKPVLGTQVYEEETV